MTLFSKLKISHIVLFSVLLRIILLFVSVIANNGTSGLIHGESTSYIGISYNIYISFKYYYHGSPEIIRTPVYPFILAISRWIGSEIMFTILLQIFLSSLSVLIIYKIILNIYKKDNYAILGSLLYSIEPFSVIYSCQLVTETTFTFLFILSIYYLTKYFQSFSMSDIIFSGLFLALSAYTRPVALYLPFIIFMVVLAYYIFTMHYTKKLVLHLFIFLFVSMFALLPWLIRNGLVANYWKFCALQDLVWYFFKAPAVLSVKNHVPFPEMQKRMGWGDFSNYFIDHPEQKTWTQAEVLKYMGKEGKRIFFHNLRYYPRIYFKGLALLILDPGSADLLKVINKYPKVGGRSVQIMNTGFIKGIHSLAIENKLLFSLSLIMGILLICYYLLFALGVFVNLKNRNVIEFIFIGIIIYLIFVSSGEFAIGRYRHPIMPFVIIFASQGFVWIRNKIKKV
jgi:4-amino-4-deoxy-L-arabinose transferase-like glycosyltransferase